MLAKNGTLRATYMVLSVKKYRVLRIWVLTQLFWLNMKNFQLKHQFKILDPRTLLMEFFEDR